MIQGILCKDNYTKKLIHKIMKNQIAVIVHEKIDLVSAQDLKYKKVKAVINCKITANISFVDAGTLYLLENDIKIFEIYDTEFFSRVADGDIALIRDNKIYINGVLYANCFPVLKNTVYKKTCNSISANDRISFFENTICHMNREIDYFLNDKNLPVIRTVIKNKDVMIISRGRFYREDLRAVRNFIMFRKPVLISVDGGADALADIGFNSDIIIGDMDSVSDKSLLMCSEILVHSYSSGYAPGAKRIESLGLRYKTVNIKGTSEDAALYLAKFKEASSIFMIGSHTGIEEFLEKDRHGMSSTVLLRMLAGSDLIDLKGINRVIIYNRRVYFRICLVCILCILIIILSQDILSGYVQTCLKLLLHLK